MPRSYITLLTNNGPCSSVRKHEILEEGSAKGIRNGNGNAPRRNNTETNVKRKNVYRKGKSLERLEQNHEDDAKVEPACQILDVTVQYFVGFGNSFYREKKSWHVCTDSSELHMTQASLSAF